MASNKYPAFTNNAIVVMNRRYLKKDEEKNPVEEPSDMMRRVSKDISLAELDYGADEKRRQEVEDEFYEIQRMLYFLPNSPTLMNAGRELQQLSACFVLPVKDDLSNIFEGVKNTALIHQSGGGTGFSFSHLRPNGDIVGSTGGVASGPVSFMQVYDKATDVVKQGGTRRGANMAILDCSHPDIIDFVNMKLDPEVMTNFNVSVSVSNAFMRAALSNQDWTLRNPRNGEATGTVNANELIRMIVANAWATGDPGLIFLDHINDTHPNQHLGPITATNPCVTADCWVMTDEGPRQVEELRDRRFRIMDENGVRDTDDRGFYHTGRKETFWLTTSHGYRVRLTGNHRVKKVVEQTEEHTTYAYVEAQDLKPGDLIPLQKHQDDWPEPTGGDRQAAKDADAVAQGHLMSATTISEMHRCSSRYHLDFATQIIQRTGTISKNAADEPCQMLIMMQPQAPIHDVQMMMLRLGVVSQIVEDGLSIGPRSMNNLMELLQQPLADPFTANHGANHEHLTTFKGLEPAGETDVYDVTVDQTGHDGMPVFDGQGFHLHNCLSGDTRLATHLGNVTLDELYRQQIEIRVLTDGRVPGIQEAERGGGVATATKPRATSVLRDAVPVFKTRGNWPVFRLRTRHGFEVVATDDHKFYTPSGPVELKDLQVGDEILLQGGGGTWNTTRTLPSFQPERKLQSRINHGEAQLPTEWSKELGQLLGWAVADGWVSAETPKGRNVPNYTVGLIFGAGEKGEMETMFRTRIRTWLGIDGCRVERHNSVALQYKSTLYYFLKSLGLRDTHATEKRVPDSIWQAPEDAVRGFLSAMITADGTVDISSYGQSCTIRLACSSEGLLQDVQLLLLNHGIVAKLYQRQPAGMTLMPDANRELAPYEHKAQYELLMDGRNRERFLSEIGFMTTAKQEKAMTWQKAHGPAPRRETYTDRVEIIEFQGLEDVYCTTESETHSIVANGFVTAQCGEQPLLEHESCNLGSINLAQIRRSTKDDEEFKNLLDSVATTATRFLDNVIDRNAYPIDEIGERTRATRRIGVGVMGFADVLIMEKIRYDSPAGIDRAQEIMKFIQEQVHATSRQLARERGPYPEWKNRTNVGEDEEPMRNTSPTTIAPTGTISIIAGVNSGIEPLFALAFERHVMDDDRLTEFNQMFLEEAERHGIKANDPRMLQVVETGSIQELDFPQEMKEIFRVSHDIETLWHVQMQAAWQNYCDNAVSKTVNMPEHATQEDVMAAYIQAWQLGCKGITVYRDGSKQDQVLSTAESRSRSENVEETSLAPQRRNRPDMLPGGTYRIRTGHGTSYITVNNDYNGLPFEIFAAGGKSGGCEEAQTQAITRLATLAMRYHIPVEEITRQLTGIICCPNWENGLLIGSPADAIAEALRRHNGDERPADMNHLPGTAYTASLPPTDGNSIIDARTHGMIRLAERRRAGLECPEPDCKGTIQQGEGCGTCTSCGWSNCG